MEIIKSKNRSMELATGDFGSEQYLAELSIIVTMMVEGRVFKNPPKEASTIIQAWYFSMKRKVPQAWLRPTFQVLCERGGWFPDVSTFIDIANELERTDGFEKVAEELINSDREGEVEFRNHLKKTLSEAGLDVDLDDPVTPEAREVILSQYPEEVQDLMRGILAERSL